VPHPRPSATPHRAGGRQHVRRRVGWRKVDGQMGVGVVCVEGVITSGSPCSARVDETRAD
jgi:hypothetical protein